LFDPMNVDIMREKMKWLLGDPKLCRHLSQWGIQRAGDFSWEKTAEKTLQVYMRVYNS